MRFLTTLTIVAVLFLTGCNDHTDSSPFSELLIQPPYSSLTDSIKKEPARDELYFHRAILLNKNNFPEPALADFKKAWSLQKQESYAVGIGNLLIEKNTQEAISFLQDAIKELPKSILLKLTLARSYDKLNKTDEALAVCNDILKEQPDQVNTLMLESDLWTKKGDSTAAIASLEKAHALVPSNLDLSFKLMYQYAENKNPKTVELTDSLIAMDSLNLHADPYYVRGVYYSNTGDRNNAIQWFDKALKYNYNYLNAYIEKGKVLLDQKKTTDALKTFQLANTIDPAFADAWYWIGRCQEIIGDKEEAKQDYEKAYGLDKTYTEAKEAAEAIK